MTEHPGGTQGTPRFLTVAEVADLMRVSRMTVYRMVHSGQLPAIRMGRSFRVPSRVVDEMIAAGLAEWEQSRASGEHG